MKVPFLYQQIKPERGHSRSTSQSGASRGLQLLDDFRSRMAPLVQRACSLPTPFARALKAAGLILAFWILFLNLPSTRPYTTDLVLKTSDLRTTPLVKPMPLDDNRAHPVNGSAPSSKHVMNCNHDTRTLDEIRQRYELDDQIEYLKRYVRFTREPIKRQSYTLLQQKLLPDDVDNGFQSLHLSKSYSDEKCHEPLDVSVSQSPFPADVDLSDFMFAMSTTAKRILNNLATIQEWAVWLTDSRGMSNGGKLLLRLLDASDAELMDVAQRLAAVGIDAEVSAWDSRTEKQMAVRYFNLVPLLFSHKDARKWLVLCDDDTFFTAINSIVAKFKQFDSTKPHYVGTLSDDIIAVQTHGSQAFGGGGVFLSRPLAKIISSVYDMCRTPAKIKQSNSGYGPQGDIILRNCIYDNTDVRLTYLWDLWQLDLTGDPSGFYESGLKPYSVHHFKGGEWHTAYPLNTTKVAHTCGEDCPYQRFVTADNFIISTGYSVAQYPAGIDFNLDQVERTFRPIRNDKGWNFDYTFGPQRPALQGTGRKISWELRESYLLEDGAVVQFYVRKKDDKRWTTKEGQPMKALDGVIELVWISA